MYHPLTCVVPRSKWANSYQRLLLQQQQQQRQQQDANNNGSSSNDVKVRWYIGSETSPVAPRRACNNSNPQNLLQPSSSHPTSTSHEGFIPSLPNGECKQMHEKIKSLFLSVSSLADPRGARDPPLPALGPIFPFRTVFGKIGQNNRLTPLPLWLMPPPVRNPGSANHYGGFGFLVHSS